MRKLKRFVLAPSCQVLNCEAMTEITGVQKPMLPAISTLHRKHVPDIVIMMAEPVLVLMVKWGRGLDAIASLNDYDYLCAALVMRVARLNPTDEVENLNYRIPQ